MKKRSVEIGNKSVVERDTEKEISRKEQSS